MQDMKKRNLQAPATKGDIDDAVAQIATVMSKTLEAYPTKSDLKKELGKFATKEDLKAVEQNLEGKIDDLAGDVSDIRRRVIDLETDTVWGNFYFHHFFTDVRQLRNASSQWVEPVILRCRCHSIRSSV